MNLVQKLKQRLRRRTPGSLLGNRYFEPARNIAAREFEVDLWVLSQFVLDRLIPVIGVHPFPLNELLLASAAVCRVKPKIVFDWGTHIGASARLFYECARAFQLDYEVHSIDLPDEASHVQHPGSEHGRLVRGLPGVHLHRGDGVSVALEQWERLGRPARPLFFVDGDHSYQSVLRELEQIFSASSDATVLAHDTFFQSQEAGYNIGPSQAIGRTLSQYPSRFKVIHSGPGLPGMTLLASTAALSSSK